MVMVGLALSLRGIALPQTTLAVYGSLALFGLLLVWPLRLPGWAALVLVAVSSLYHGVRAGGVLRESVALPVAQSTAMAVLLVFLFLAAYHHAGRRLPGGTMVRLLGLATALLAVLWRFAEYREWIGGEVAVEATMGLFPLPVLTISPRPRRPDLMWPRKRRFQPEDTKRGGRRCIGGWRTGGAVHRFRRPGCAVQQSLSTRRGRPPLTEARPIMDMLLTDTYLAFNLPDEDAAFDRLARNLSEDLVPGVYLDSRRRLTAGTRKGAEVTVKDVSVMSVGAPSAHRFRRRVLHLPLQVGRDGKGQALAAHSRSSEHIRRHADHPGGGRPLEDRRPRAVE